MNKLKLKTPDIIFDEGKHTYTHVPTGDLWTGVTTIIKTKAKEFLPFWTTKENYNFMMENWDLSKTYTSVEKKELLLQAKNAWSSKSKESMAIGTKAHKLIEDYLNDTHTADNRLFEDEQDKIANQILDMFIKWEKDHKVEWLATELLVASEEHKFAGTLDAIAVIDGKTTLLDFKTNNQINDDVFLQTAAYQLALEEMGYHDIEQRAVLRLGKTDKEAEYYVIQSRLDFDKETFLNCRQLHRHNVYIESQFKDRKGRIVVPNNDSKINKDSSEQKDE